MEPQSQHSDLGFFKLMPRASVIRTFEFTNQGGDQTSLIRMLFYPVVHGALTLPHFLSQLLHITGSASISWPCSNRSGLSCCNDFRR